MVFRQIRLFDDEIRQILNDIADTMYNTKNGVGLAGPQVGILKRNRYGEKTY